MDRFGPSRLGGGNDAITDQIGFARRGWADMHGFIGFADVERFRIGVGIDCDGADAETPGGADDAAGDLAAIGYEQGLDHERLPNTSPIWGGGPAAGWWRGWRATQAAVIALTTLSRF
ncbi:hypothetical protein GCM10019071_41860 [Sphingobium fuliginis]|uniref:Uncharacterized protein n=1 Tax=Sphingobium fuliginis (strain ATCC 27551) TaxID=336203 RepID=A0ABQ1FCE5_SPHSA|nr:hypothetical protein GCM10019071_41860 [Sphingobium fuliginis]